MRHLSLSVLACLIVSAAQAQDQTMTNLANAGRTIQDQLSASAILSAGAGYYASVGGIIEDGTMTQAQLDQAMVDAYNSALNTVLTTEYYNASMLLEDQYDVTMARLSTAIDDLTAAASVLAVAGVVADMAAEAVTTEDNLQVQAAVSVMDASLTAGDVSNYNNALSNVENLAQSAAGFLAASQNSSVTGAIDSYAANNNISMASYSAVTFNVNQNNTDFLTVMFMDNTYGIGFSGAMVGDFKTANDVWGAGMNIYGGS